MRSRIPVTIAFLVALTITGCGTGTEPGMEPGPPGSVTYRLVSPNDLEGGVLFSVPASQVTGIAQAFGITVVLQESSDALHVAAISRFATDDLRFTLDVAHRDTPPTLQIESVVGPDNRLRSSAGYALVVVP